MSSAMLSLLWLAVLLLPAAASAQLTFSLASQQMQLAKCQPDADLGAARSDVECLTRAGQRAALLAEFDPDTGRCSATPHCDQLVLADAPAESAASPKRKFVSDGVRRLLFSVQAGSGVRSNDSYASAASCNDPLLLPPRGQPPAAPLWRSCWLDKLGELVQRLRLTSISVHVVKDGVDVLNVSFGASAAGLSLWNWFRKDNVLTYWPASLNLQSNSYNYFSIAGLGSADPIQPLSRSFYISLMHKQCPGDIGFLLVSDVSDPCSYASGSSPPLIAYSTDSGTAMESSAAKADYLLVSVQ